MGSFIYQVFKEGETETPEKTVEVVSREECIADLEHIKEQNVLTDNSCFLLSGDIEVSMTGKAYGKRYELKGDYSHSNQPRS